MRTSGALSRLTALQLEIQFWILDVYLFIFACIKNEHILTFILTIVTDLESTKITLYFICIFSVPDCRFKISWISRECTDIPLSHSYNYKVKRLIIDSPPLLHFFPF